MPLVRVCRTSELRPGEAYRVNAASPIAVFNVGGEFFAIDDTCTHAEASLSQGYVDGETVECAFHMSRFNIRTGEVLSLPATRSLRTYPVVVRGDEIYVDV